MINSFSYLLGDLDGCLFRLLWSLTQHLIFIPASIDYVVSHLPSLQLFFNVSVERLKLSLIATLKFWSLELFIKQTDCRLNCFQCVESQTSGSIRATVLQLPGKETKSARATTDKLPLTVVSLPTIR